MEVVVHIVFLGRVKVDEVDAFLLPSGAFPGVVSYFPTLQACIVSVSWWVVTNHIGLSMPLSSGVMVSSSVGCPRSSNIHRDGLVVHGARGIGGVILRALGAIGLLEEWVLAKVLPLRLKGATLGEGVVLRAIWIALKVLNDALGLGAIHSSLFDSFVASYWWHS